VACGRQLLEAEGVDVGGIDAQQVATVAGLDRVGAVTASREGPPQPGDVKGDGLPAAGRSLVAPQFVEDALETILPA
jgi:hypothetical protein